MAKSTKASKKLDQPRLQRRLNRAKQKRVFSLQSPQNYNESKTRGQAFKGNDKGHAADVFLRRR